MYSIKLSNNIVFAIIAVISVFIVSCEQEITGKRAANQPPETFIFIESVDDDTLNAQQSVQRLYWDGRDPDGFVQGFLYSWEEAPTESDWIFTTSQSELFPLEITGMDTTYTFRVRAVDNENLADPTPAEQLLPIINSPPSVEWIVNTRIPDTTFTVASFAWAASDPDGDLTIDYFEYALDTPDEWRSIPGLRRSLTINADSGLVPGNHILFLRAVDIAGAYSNVIQMPDLGSWYVKEPSGSFLLIDDYEAESVSAGTPDAYYKELVPKILAETGTSTGYDYWNIKKLLPPSRTQFTETLKLYDRVLWYSDLVKESDANFIAAQIAIPEFRQAGGKLVYTLQFNTGFGELGNPLEFSPVDSLGQQYNFVRTGDVYYPDTQFAQTFGFDLPELKVTNFIFGLIAFKPKVTAIPMYRYDDPNREDDPMFVLLGFNDNSKEYDFVFSGTPLHLLRGNNNLDELFIRIYKDIF
jgi:hypothetical protein